MRKPTLRLKIRQMLDGLRGDAVRKQKSEVAGSSGRLTMSRASQISTNCLTPDCDWKRILGLKWFILQMTCLRDLHHFCGSDDCSCGRERPFPTVRGFVVPRPSSPATGINRVSSSASLILQTADNSLSLP